MSQISDNVLLNMFGKNAITVSWHSRSSEQLEWTALKKKRKNFDKKCFWTMHLCKICDSSINGRDTLSILTAMSSQNGRLKTKGNKIFNSTLRNFQKLNSHWMR